MIYIYERVVVRRDKNNFITQEEKQFYSKMKDFKFVKVLRKIKHRFFPV